MINFSKINWLIIVLIVIFFLAGVFFFQWWQVKGELVRQIGQNENLMKQMGELQKEINELKTTEERVTDETADWETYRNEKYGFEIDHPTAGWEFDGEEETFYLAKQLSKEQKDEESSYQFHISGQMLFLYPECYNYSGEEILTKSYECLLGGPSVDYEGEITTDFGVKGYKGKGGGTGYGRIESVFFPLPGKVKWGRNKIEYQPILIIYYDLDTHYTNKEIEAFNKVISSFRYIEK